MKTLTLLALTASLVLTLSISPASALTVPEKLVYDVSWTGFAAATAVQEITANGNDLHITSTTRSSGWLNPIFSVNDRTESVISRGSGADHFGVPKSYKEKISEGRYRAQKEAKFDPENLKVETRDFIKKTEKTESISPKTFDTLSIIYFIRSMELTPGKSIYVDVYDCKRLWKTEVQVLRREEVDTSLGRFKTLVVKPLMRCDGVSKRPTDLTVWVTDDALRIPVKMTSKVKVGKVTAMLKGGSYWPKND